MAKAVGFWLLLCWLSMAGQVQAAQGEIEVRAAVPLSIEYEWVVKRQSMTALPSTVQAGDRLVAQGLLLRGENQPLVGTTVVLMMGRGEQVESSTMTATGLGGEYELVLAPNQEWRGEYWLSIAAMTTGRPLWLIDRQSITWLAPSIGRQPSTVVWQIYSHVDAVWSKRDIQQFTDDNHATIRPSKPIIHDVQRRVRSSIVAPLARGRDSPVADRSFGVSRWAVG